MQLKIQNLRNFDKYLRKQRRKGTITCSSRSTYSFNNVDISEMQDEEDSSDKDAECDDEDEDLVSRLDIEEDQLGEIEEQLIAT